MKDNVVRGLILEQLYQTRHARQLVQVPQELKLEGVNPEVLRNVCRQLGEQGLIDWTGFIGGGSVARITAYGVDVVEGTAQSPISVVIEHMTDNSVNVHGSSSVQIGDGNIQAPKDGARASSGDEPLSESTIAYLKRAFSRLCEDAVQSAQKERVRVMADASKHGALQSGGMLIAVTTEYDRAADKAAAEMVQLAFDATGSIAEPVCTAVEQGLKALRYALSNDLAQFFNSQAGWAPRMNTEGLGNGFLNAMDKRTTATIDDLRHGMLGGTRLAKDPLVNVISTISHSPGAVLQSGVGNVQHAATSAAVNDIRSALTQFMNSKEVQALTGENKQSVADVAEVIDGELAKPQPDASKISRWGKRLIEIAERIGIGVAASGLSRALFG